MNEEVPQKKFVACHVPEKQRVPHSTITSGLSEFHERAVTACGVKTSIENLGNIAQPILTCSAYDVGFFDSPQVLRVRKRKVPLLKDGICLFD
jgi:hypothetical protein